MRLRKPNKIKQCSFPWHYQSSVAPIFGAAEEITMIHEERPFLSVQVLCLYRATPIIPNLHPPFSGPPHPVFSPPPGVASQPQSCLLLSSGPRSSLLIYAFLQVHVLAVLGSNTQKVASNQPMKQVLKQLPLSFHIIWQRLFNILISFQLKPLTIKENVY